MKKIKDYMPVPAIVMIALAILSGIIHLISVLSEGFADFFNLKIASAFRFIFAKITGILPFSFAEVLIVLLPVWITIIIIIAVNKVKQDKKRQIRFLSSVFAVITFFYSSFVMTFATAYRGTPLENKLSLEREKLSARDIYVTAEAIKAQLDSLRGEIEYLESGFSIMPYSFSELNSKLNSAYKRGADKYGFLNGFSSNVKEIMLSEPMTYTHISGVYTYFTGEANVNVNYPDYVIPFTVAHEMAHQRGIAREDEANFVAFLICLESDDAYVRYSAYFNMFEYLFSSLYKADSSLAKEFAAGVPLEIKKEIAAYSDFFEKYSDSVAANVSDAVNNSYLVSQGQTAGVRSYGLVTELAVAYYNSLNK